MSDFTQHRWASDINRYARLLRLKDLSSTLLGIETCERMLASIRNTWPTQTKIFDDMDRELPQT